MKNKGVNIKYILFFVVTLYFAGFYLPVKCQNTIKNYPVQFHQFIFSYPLINPASLGSNLNNEIILGYQKPITGFTGISTYFINVGFLPYQPKNKSYNKSIVGFRLFNDREGAYINRTRFYGIYAFHTRLTNKINFAGGIDFGGMNYSVKSTPTTSGASAFAVDANSGIWFYNKNFHIGLSVNQLFNSSLQPLDEITELPLHFNITASQVIVSNDFIQIRPHLLITMPYYNKTGYRGSLYSLLFNKIIAVVGWNHQTDISVLLGLHNLDVLNHNLDLIVSYGTSIKQVSIGIKTIELSLLYDFSSKKQRF
jgi:type IX secretion system PorP/SprF family membrane protein